MMFKDIDWNTSCLAKLHPRPIEIGAIRLPLATGPGVKRPGWLPCSCMEWPWPGEILRGRVEAAQTLAPAPRLHRKPAAIKNRIALFLRQPGCLLPPGETRSFPYPPRSGFGFTV